MRKSHKQNGRRMKVYVEGSLNVAIFKEGRMFVAYAPALDLVAQGNSMAEARKNFGEVLDIYMEETTSKGTLEKDLLRCGWQKHAGSIQPPLVASFPESEKLGRDIQLKALAIMPLTGRVCLA